MRRWLSFLVVIFVSVSFVLKAQQNTGLQNSTRYPAYPIGPHSNDDPEIKKMLSESLPLLAPIFVESDKISSSLVIVNNSAVYAGATISIRNLAGLQITRLHRTLAPHEQQEIALKSLLSGLPVQTGSLSVIQDPNLKGTTVYAQVLLTNHGGALPSYVDEELAMPSMNGSSILRGVADESIDSALIAVTNISEIAQHVSLRCLTQKGDMKPKLFTIAPAATVLISSCSGATAINIESYLQSVSTRQGSTVQGYELVSDANIVRPNIPSDQYAQTPQIYGVGHRPCRCLLHLEW